MCVRACLCVFVCALWNPQIHRRDLCTFYHEVYMQEVICDVQKHKDAARLSKRSTLRMA